MRILKVQCIQVGKQRSVMPRTVSCNDCPALATRHNLGHDRAGCRKVDVV